MTKFRMEGLCFFSEMLQAVIVLKWKRSPGVELRSQPAVPGQLLWTCGPGTFRADPVLWAGLSATKHEIKINYRDALPWWREASFVGEYAFGMKIGSIFKRQTAEDKFNKTLVQYQKAAEQNPNDIRIHVKMAELYLENGKKDESIREYLVAAHKYEEKRLFQIAVAIYNHAISIDPDQITVYTELANLHLRNGFVGDGVAVLEKLAHHYYEQDKVFEAAQVLKKQQKVLVI